jgi:hypothetical protein
MQCEILLVMPCVSYFFWKGECVGYSVISVA